MNGSLTAGLRARNIDVVTAEEAGMRGIPDERHLEFAAEAGRPIFSFNRRDFARIHRDWMAGGRTHSGVILLTNRRASVGYQIRELVAVLGMPTEALENGLHYI